MFRVSKDVRYNSLPESFQDVLLELMQKKENQGRTFVIKFLSGLIDKINAAYSKHLVSSYAHNNSLKFQYLSPKFFKYFGIEENPSLKGSEETLKSVKSMIRRKDTRGEVFLFLHLGWLPMAR